MNSAGRRIIQKILAILVILTMTMADFTMVGVNLISYAADLVQINNENVAFNVYFLDGNRTLETTADINKKDLKLAIELGVRKDGYLSNGRIELPDDTNFKFKKETTDSHIKNITDRVIELNQINEEESIRIEVGIEFIALEQMNIDYLNKTSTIKLLGKYINSKNVERNENIDIEGTADVKINWVSPNEISSELKASLLTHYRYNIDGQEKEIVQLLISSKIVNNSYPVKNTNIEVDLSRAVNNVTVHKRSSKATNGDRNFEYEYRDGKLTISVQNGIDNKISWNKDSEDAFVVTMEYPEIVAQETSITEPLNRIPVVATIMTYDNKTLTQRAEIMTTENKNGIVSGVITEKESQIGKGKIYVGEARNYIETSKIYIDYAKAIQKIELEEKQPVFMAEEEKRSNIEYVQTTIDKNQFLELFGETGTLKIQDQNEQQLAIINKDTVAGENGKIVIKYNTGVTSIKVITSSPEKEGTLNLENQKTILSTEYTREELKQLTKIKDSNEITFSLISEQTQKINSEAIILLKETETKATLSIDPLTLSTSQNGQELNIKVVLETNNEYKDLYKNPQINIQLPKQINSINAQCELLYANGLSLDTFKVNASNSTIVANLRGEQTTYEGDAVQGTTLLIKAIVKLDKLSTNSKEQIVLNYTNENAIKYADNQEEKVDISVVSENSMILVNNIAEYNVSTMGNEGTKEINLESKAEAKRASVQMQLVNNEETDISNVGILGKIALEAGKIDRTSAIRTSKEATIYYTNVENPTTQLSRPENAWTTENIQDAKFYLIVIKNMKNGEKITFSYDILISKNLPYNITVETGYKVIYTNTRTGNQKQAQSTIIQLTTGKVAEIKTTLSAEVSGEALKDGDEVKAGEIIKYTAVVSNTGREKAENVSITATIPENTTLIEINPQYMSAAGEGMEIEKEEDYFKEKADKQITLSNLTIEAGQSKELRYMVRVNSKLSETLNAQSDLTVKYLENQEKVTLRSILTKASLVATLVPVLRTGEQAITYGNDYVYKLNVENITNKEQKNVQITINKNDLLDIKNIDYTSGEDYKEIENQGLTFTIDSIAANDTAYVEIDGLVKPISLNLKVAEMSATIKDSEGILIRSNKLSERVEGVTASASLSVSTNSSNGYLNPGDEIKYSIKVKNTSTFKAENLVIEDRLSDYLEVESLTLNGTNCEYSTEEEVGEGSNYNVLSINSPLNSGEETTVEIKAKVDEDIYTEEVLKVSNKALVYNNVLLAETDEKVNYIESAPKLPEDNGDNEGEDGDDEGDNGSNGEDGDNIPKYVISGTVWEDIDQNGSRDSGENLLDGITVYAIDVSTNEIAKDANEEEIMAITDEDGFYTLTNVPKGKYIVAFEYDTDGFMTTIYKAEGVTEDTNSDAVKSTITIGDEQKTLAITDSIEVNSSISNIDLGLTEAKVFNLQLDKVISKMIVTNSEGTKTYNFDESRLAKIEISSKNLKDSTVAIEYKIKVTNKGEIAGYAKSIVDYVPSSLTFNSGLNSDWYQKGDNLYTSSLANTLIEPGETKEVTLVLTKKMTESNTGLTNNKAAIETAYNTLGLTNEGSALDGDSEYGSPDNLGSADTIIGVKTGAAVSYVVLTLTIVIVLAASAYLINKKILIEKIKI